jgi:hypothetical protein
MQQLRRDSLGGYGIDAIRQQWADQMAAFPGADGKIVSETMYYDNMAAYTALGLLPS